MKIRVEKSWNYYRTLHITYSLFVTYRGKVYRFSLLHRKLPFDQILSIHYALLQDNARLQQKVKDLEKRL